ncbi:MAG: patatin-like phospholipase family protein [Leptospiraceae bacterium]|nr:patatin-like phospholipase family protein [Leptospiraceae bacterium]
MGQPRLALAFAGGGCKALYALGVGYTLRQWGLKFHEMSGVSAGAAFILTILSEEEEEALEYFEELVKRNPKNMYFLNLLKGKRPFPHENMYRRAIRNSLNLDKIKKSGTKIFILSIRAFPRMEKYQNYYRKARLIPQTARAIILDEKDKERGIPCNRVERIVHRWNLTEVIFTEKDFIYPEMVEQIIMNSSSVPPVVSFQRISNEYYIDGGVTNNLLLEKFSPGIKKIAVHYDDVTIVDKDKKLLSETFLIQPKGGKLPITTFDYTNAKKARATYELGKEDAEKLKTKIYDYLYS